VSGLLDPDHLAEELRAQQAEAERASQALRDRLTLVVEESIAEHDQQIERLLDLYLSSDDFPKELLDEKKAKLTMARQELGKERGTRSGVIARHGFLCRTWKWKWRNLQSPIRRSLRNDCSQ